MKLNKIILINFDLSVWILLNFGSIQIYLGHSQYLM